MVDLYVGIVSVWVVAIVTFEVFRRSSVRWSVRQRTVTAAGVMATGAVWFLYVRDHVLLSSVFPFSNLIVLTSWYPIFCGVLGAMAWNAAKTGNRWRKLWPVAALAGLGVFASVQPLLGTPPECGDQWADGVCLQSTPRSCSAACAATLLRRYGIDATEAELATSCLTRNGTTWQGLYRGLSLETRGTPWHVRVAEVSSDELASGELIPAIISVGIPAGAVVDPVYSQTYGWPEGQLHSVVLTGFASDGRPQIADPSVGRESWSREDLDVLFRGNVIRLVRSN